MNQTHLDVSNRFLFSLEKSEELGIPSKLKTFFLEREFPWHCLGKTLTEFITAWIESVPPRDRIRGTIDRNAWVRSSALILIEEGACVEPGAYVDGPTILLKGSTVRHGAYVRGSVVACDGAVIGHTTEVKGSVLLPHAKAAHFNYVGDSILGVHTNLGAGTKLANLRFDNGQILIRKNGEKVPTGLRKFGAIFGNNAQAGCNAVTNPGTILMPGAALGPNKTALGIQTGAGG